MTGFYSDVYALSEYLVTFCITDQTIDENYREVTDELVNAHGEVVYREFIEPLDELMAYKDDNFARTVATAGKKRKKGKNFLLSSITENDVDIDIIRKIYFFRDTFISEPDLRSMISEMPNSEFEYLYVPTAKIIYEKEIFKIENRSIRPITLKTANRFVDAYHRHHKSVTGCKFALGCFDESGERPVMLGCVICGRPVSRHLDDNLTLEVNRLCTAGPQVDDVCSMLYSAAVRVATEMGYNSVITYTLEHEDGSSLKASNFVSEGMAGAPDWTGKRKRGDSDGEFKTRWRYTIRKDDKRRIVKNE